MILAGSHRKCIFLAKKLQIPTDSCTLSCEQIRGWESCTTWYHDFFYAFILSGQACRFYIAKNSASQSKIAHFFGVVVGHPTSKKTSKEEAHEELQTEAARHLYSRALIQGNLGRFWEFFFAFLGDANQMSRKPGCFGPGMLLKAEVAELPSLRKAFLQTQRWRDSLKNVSSPKSCLPTAVGGWTQLFFWGEFSSQKNLGKWYNLMCVCFFYSVWKTANLVFRIFPCTKNSLVRMKLRSSFASPVKILRIWAESQGSAEVFVAPNCGWHRAWDFFLFSGQFMSCNLKMKELPKEMNSNEFHVTKNISYTVWLVCCCSCRLPQEWVFPGYSPYLAHGRLLPTTTLCFILPKHRAWK